MSTLCHPVSILWRPVPPFPTFHYLAIPCPTLYSAILCSPLPKLALPFPLLPYAVLLSVLIRRTFAVGQLPRGPSAVLVAAVHVAALHLKAWPAVIGDAAVVVEAAALLESVQDLTGVTTFPGCGEKRRKVHAKRCECWWCDFNILATFGTFIVYFLVDPFIFAVFLPFQNSLDVRDKNVQEKEC